MDQFLRVEPEETDNLRMTDSSQQTVTTIKRVTATTVKAAESNNYETTSDVRSGRGGGTRSVLSSNTNTEMKRAGDDNSSAMRSGGSETSFIRMEEGDNTSNFGGSIYETGNRGAKRSSQNSDEEIIERGGSDYDDDEFESNFRMTEQQKLSPQNLDRKQEQERRRSQDLKPKKKTFEEFKHQNEEEQT